MGCGENRLCSPGMCGTNANCSVERWLSPAISELRVTAGCKGGSSDLGTPSCGNNTQKDGVKHGLLGVTEGFPGSCKKLSHSFQMQV